MKRRDPGKELAFSAFFSSERDVHLSKRCFFPKVLASKTCLHQRQENSLKKLSSLGPMMNITFVHRNTRGGGGGEMVL